MENLSKHKIVITALSRYNKTPTLKLPSYRFHDLYLLLDFRPLINRDKATLIIKLEYKMEEKD